MLFGRFFWQKILTDPRTTAFAAALVLFAIVPFVPQIFNDGDTYWHIAAGRWMIDNRAVLHIDPFSYSFAGKPWQAHEWLAEIVMALAYVGLGWNGLALLFAACVALTAGLLGWHLRRNLSGIVLTATLILSLCCISGSLLARPHLMALPLLEIWTAGLLRARSENRMPHWGLLFVMLLWANLHASFMLGLALIVPFLLELVGEKQYEPAKRWALFAVLAVIAAMLTPNGAAGLMFPFMLLGMPALYAISEWLPTNLNQPDPFILATGAALYVLLSRGARIRPWRLIVLLGLVYMALAHTRHAILVGIVGPLFLAEPLANAVSDGPRHGRASAPLTAIFILLLALTAAVRLMIPASPPDNNTTPAAALAHVPAAYLHTPVLNEYSFGGYLIFRDVRPFIDGRAELYGQDFMARYVRIANGNQKTLQESLAAYHVRWSILAANNPSVAVLDRLPGWKRVYADRVAVVHLRVKSP